MRILILSALLLTLPAVGSAQSSMPERWDVTSTVVDMVVPGGPGFVLRMAKGKSRAEQKCVAAGHTVAALLTPDPKAQCRIDKQQIADGRYAQTLSCPRKRGGPMQVTRSGTYNASGFVGRAEMTGETPKGAMRVVLDQRAARVAGKCRS
ncbi:DUF3617 domain-containing protein [Sphingomonas radiodurans]|uniref:DUF3617 domain-containing protein n=1 Tax=Sphingomonas radiodurans TaxID=2890321 RepID=UPI001E33DCDD|nr:DUF3617 family protein [Sphingomonas radiodurans]WBH15884.1 DUF3617 family protein [Sphingomonas radiodurans]